MMTSLARTRLAPARRQICCGPFYRRLDPWTGLNGLQDKKVLKYLPTAPGFFIEAGANDGLKQSNTFYLESRRGWRGLLVEPIPELASVADEPTDVRQSFRPPW